MGVLKASSGSNYLLFKWSRRIAADSCILQRLVNLMVYLVSSAVFVAHLIWTLKSFLWWNRYRVWQFVYLAKSLLLLAVRFHVVGAWLATALLLELMPVTQGLFLVLYELFISGLLFLGWRIFSGAMVILFPGPQCLNLCLVYKLKKACILEPWCLGTLNSRIDLC